MIMALVSLARFGGLATTNFSEENISFLIGEARKRYTEWSRKVEDMVVLQEVNISLAKGKVVSESRVYKKREKFRVESRVLKPEPDKGRATITIFDGEDYWLITSIGRRKLFPDEVKQIRIEANWWELISDPDTATVDKVEYVSGSKCYVILLEEKQNPIQKIWIDSSALTLIKAAGLEPRKKEEILWCYSDFRQVGPRWWFPFKTEIYENGQLISTSFIKSFDVNQNVSDELFNASEERWFNLKEVIREIIGPK